MNDRGAVAAVVNANDGSGFNSASTARTLNQQLHGQVGIMSSPAPAAITVPITLKQLTAFKPPPPDTAALGDDRLARGAPTPAAAATAATAGSLSTADPAYSFLIPPTTTGGTCVPYIAPLALPKNSGIYYGDTIFCLKEELEQPIWGAAASSAVPPTAAPGAARESPVGQHLYIQVPHGVGVALMRDGSRYGGEWCRGHYHGNGVLTCASFDYQGGWDTDRMHGYGVMHYHDNLSSGSYLSPKGTVESGAPGAGSGSLLAGGSNIPVVGLVIRGVAFLSPFEGTHQPLEYMGEFDRTHHRHGRGIMKYRNGDVYNGQWASNRRQGKGQLLESTGDMYDGEWVADERNGYGIIQYSTGSVFKGMLVRNRRSGEGVMTFTNGDEYFGNFANDVICGHGVMRYKNGDVYEGMWNDGVRHGEGKYTLKKSGVVMRGHFVNGLAQGEGIVEFPGVSTFVGDFDKGERRSGTIFVYKGGTTLDYCYQGQWVGEAMHGRGLMWFGNGDFACGKWVKNKREGPGNVRYADGSEYSGNFVGDKRHGSGILQTKDGSIMAGTWVEDTFVHGYEGEWDGAAFNGVGNIRLPNGDEFCGVFLAGKRHGSGILRLHRLGHVIKGSWKEDVLSCSHASWRFGSSELYVGGFVNGVRDSLSGTMWLRDGSVFSGEWKYGVPNGQGTFYAKSVGAPLYKWLPPNPCSSSGSVSEEPSASTGESDESSGIGEALIAGTGIGFFISLFRKKKDDEAAESKSKRLFMGFKDRYVLSATWSLGRVPLGVCNAALESQRLKELSATEKAINMTTCIPATSKSALQLTGPAAADPSTQITVGVQSGPGTVFYPSGVMFTGEWVDNYQKLVIPHRQRSAFDVWQASQKQQHDSDASAALTAVKDPLVEVVSADGAASVVSALQKRSRPVLQDGPPSGTPPAAGEQSIPSESLPGASGEEYTIATKIPKVPLPLPRKLRASPPPPAAPVAPTDAPPQPQPTGSADAAERAERHDPLHTKGARVCTFCAQEFGFFRKETACGLCLRCSCSYCLHEIEVDASPSLRALVRLEWERALNKDAKFSVGLGAAPRGAPSAPLPASLPICGDCGRVVLENITEGTLWIPGIPAPSTLMNLSKEGADSSGQAADAEPSIPTQPTPSCTAEAAGCCGSTHAGPGVRDRSPRRSATQAPPVVYRGLFSRGVPHIYGSLWYGKKRYYVGEFSSGKIHGCGTQIFSSGEKYVGQWCSNLRHGLGTYRCEDGAALQGIWSRGRLEVLWYHGEVDEQLRRHGRGQSYDEDGVTYNGEWHRDVRHGTGILQYPSGVVYSGEFINGRIEGEGKLVHESSVFYGTFKAGKKHGRGTERFGECVVEGTWRDDVLSGPVHIFEGLTEEIYQTTYLNGSERDDCFLIPTMVSDEGATACHSCKSAFSFFLRRHHCRLCGQVFCDRCSSFRALLPRHFNVEGLQRVCGQCFRSIERRRMLAVRWYNTGHMYAGCWSQGRWQSRGLYQRVDGTCIVFDDAGLPIGSQRLPSGLKDPYVIGEASEEAVRRVNLIPDDLPPSPQHAIDAFVVWWKQMNLVCELSVTLDLQKIPQRLAQAALSVDQLAMAALDGSLPPLFQFPKIPAMKPLKLFMVTDDPEDNAATLRRARYMPSLIPARPEPPLAQRPPPPPGPANVELSDEQVMEMITRERLEIFMPFPPPSHDEDTPPSTSGAVARRDDGVVRPVILASYVKRPLFPDTPQRPAEGSNKVVPWSTSGVAPVPCYSQTSFENCDLVCPFWKPLDCYVGERIGSHRVTHSAAEMPDLGHLSNPMAAPDENFVASESSDRRVRWTPVYLDGSLKFTMAYDRQNGVRVSQTYSRNAGVE